MGVICTVEAEGKESGGGDGEGEYYEETFVWMVEGCKIWRGVEEEEEREYITL